MNKKELILTLNYTGAFIAWVIGSGFATGQEILQFFSSYSLKSFAVLVVNLVGFTVLGLILVIKGYENRNTKDFNHYEFYCGKLLGKLYSYVIPATLILIICVLISAAGATFNQYFSINPYIGSAIMATLLLSTYLLNFERMIKIISFVSPFVIIFTILIGVITLVRDWDMISSIGSHTAELSAASNCPGWFLSALLYLSINFICGCKYYTTLGYTAVSKKALITGTVLGSVILIGTIAVINVSILLYGDVMPSVSVPTLYLALKISPVFGALFSVMLILGMYVSSATAFWSFCSDFFKNDKKKNRIFSVSTVIICLLLGLIPFGNLMSVLYPAIGYSGLIFVAAMIKKAFDN